MAILVGSHYRDQIIDTSLGPSSIHYLHIKRSSGVNRTGGTMEMICCGELGGTQAGNGLAYYKAAWSSWNYQTDGSHSVVLINNTRENDGALGTTIQVGPLSITGHTVSGLTAYSFTSSELIYPIYTGWYGFLEINLEWAQDANLQYQLDTTSTPVF